MLSLTSVGDYLSISYNDFLATFDMPFLPAVGGDLYVYDNAFLTSLAGFTSLATVGGDLNISYNSTVYNCLSQAEAEAFAATINVAGSIDVSGNGAYIPCP